MLKFIQKYLILLIFIVVIGGLLNIKFFGGYQFSPLICLVAALVMIYPSLVPLSFDKIGEIKKHKKLIVISIFFNFLLAPMVAYFAGNLFLGEEPALRLGLIILALLPGGGMVTTWALKTKADMMTTVGIVLVNLFLAIIIVPFGISFAMKKLNLNAPMAQDDLYEQNIASVVDKSVFGAEATGSGECAVSKIAQGGLSCNLTEGAISPMKIAIPILFIVFLPLVLAFLTQREILKRKGEEYFSSIKKKFGAFSNFGLLVVVFILMSLESNKIIFQHLDLFFRVFWSLVVFYGLIFSVIFFVYKKIYHHSGGKALFWGSYLRYITLTLGLAISLVYQNSSLSPVILVVVLSYLIQIPSSFLITKMLAD